MFNRFIAHLLDNPGALGVAFFLQERKRSAYQMALRDFRDHAIGARPYNWIRFCNDSRLILKGDAESDVALREICPSAIYMGSTHTDHIQNLFANLTWRDGLVFSAFNDEPLSFRDYWLRTYRP